MNSNISLFGDDRPLCFEDMDWNLDQVFATDNSPNVAFDMVDTGQHLLDSNPDFQNTDILLQLNADDVSLNDHISPRGIAEGLAEHGEQSAEHRHSTSVGKMLPVTRKNVNAQPLEADPASYAHPSASKEATHFKSNSPENNQMKPFPESQPVFHHQLALTENATSPEIPEEENLETQLALHSHIFSRPELHPMQTQIGEVQQLIANVEPTVNKECPQDSLAPELVPKPIASDPLEALVQLPHHVTFNEGLDQILQLETIHGAEDDQNGPHTMLQVPLEIPSHGMVSPDFPTTQQVDLSSNTLLQTHDPAPSYNVQTELYENGQSLHLDAADSSGLRAEPSSMGNDRIPYDVRNEQLAQDPFAEYQLTLNPQLRSGMNLNLPFLDQNVDDISRSTLVTEGTPSRYRVSPALPAKKKALHVSNGIQKKRGRKPNVRDPARPPPTPHRSNFTLSQLNDMPMSAHIASAHEPIPRKRDFAASLRAAKPPPDFLQGPALPARQRPSGAVLTPRTGRPALSQAKAYQITNRPQRSPKQGQQVQREKPPIPAPNITKAGVGAAAGRVTKRAPKKGGRVNPEYAHLSVEERRSLRAKRNRESAEKSRVRRKVQTAELEMSVAELRDENKSLKGQMLRFQTQLVGMSSDVVQNAARVGEGEHVLRQRTPALFNAMAVLQRVIHDCPRTFRPTPHSPEIQLKVKRSLSPRADAS